MVLELMYKGITRRSHASLAYAIPDEMYYENLKKAARKLSGPLPAGRGP